MDSTPDGLRHQQRGVISQAVSTSQGNRHTREPQQASCRRTEQRPANGQQPTTAKSASSLHSRHVARRNIKVSHRVSYLLRTGRCFLSTGVATAFTRMTLIVPHTNGGELNMRHGSIDGVFSRRFRRHQLPQMRLLLLRLLL